MMSASNLSIVMIHGLPDRLDGSGPHPRTQLQEIEDHLADRFAIPEAKFKFFCWFDPENQNPKEFAKLRRDGTFSHKFARDFDRFIAKRVPGDYIVVAYSLGTYIVFRWLSKRKLLNWTRSPLGVFVLASFYDARKISVPRENGTLRFFPFNEKPIEPREIIRHLGAGKLTVFLAKHDERVPFESSDFAELATTRVVRQELIETNHDGIRRHPDVKSVICDELAEILNREIRVFSRLRNWLSKVGKLHPSSSRSTDVLKDARTHREMNANYRK